MKTAKQMIKRLDNFVTEDYKVASYDIVKHGDMFRLNKKLKTNDADWNQLPLQLSDIYKTEDEAEKAGQDWQKTQI